MPEWFLTEAYELIRHSSFRRTDHTEPACMYMCYSLVIKWSMHAMSTNSHYHKLITMPCTKSTFYISRTLFHPACFPSYINIEFIGNFNAQCYTILVHLSCVCGFVPVYLWISMVPCFFEVSFLMISPNDILELHAFTNVQAMGLNYKCKIVFNIIFLRKRCTFIL